jgi:pimeloyl-ACP methyl ester carboxylesterase
MKTLKRILSISVKFFAITLAILVIMVFVVPYLIPVPSMNDTLEPSQLAAEDSLFVDVEGLSIHYKQWAGSDNHLILMHGFGASVFSWQRVAESLGEFGTVIAYDRPAFGLSERLLPADFQDKNPYTRTYQPELLKKFMDAQKIKSAVLIGNSAGGTVAVQMALEYPQYVNALILVDPALLTTGGSPAWLRPLFRLPSIDRIGPLIVRTVANRSLSLLDRAFHDPSKISTETREGYTRPFRVRNWDLAFWEFLKATEDLVLANRLEELSVPVLVITGDDDRIVPTGDSIRAAGMIPDAELVVIPACGHVPQEECPEEFLKAVADFMKNR